MKFILKILFLILKILFLIIYFVLNSALVLFAKAFFFIIALPFSIIKLINSFFSLMVYSFRELLLFFLNKSFLFFRYFYDYYILDSIKQIFFHLSSLKLFKSKIMRRFYFYRRVYRLTGGVKFLLSSILTVEPNALLIKHLVQPLKLSSIKFLNIPSTPTKVGYRFRVLRRLIKFIVGILTLFYPLQLALRFSAWHLSSYLLNFLKFLRRKEIIKKPRQTVFFLKFIIWIKLVFVWNDLPFILLFKPGVSKKYPQFEDMQPDVYIIKSEVWDFAISRDCYFDEDDVLNGYYLFHAFRKFSKSFFNFLLILILIVYTLIVNFLIMLQFLFFFFYIPFKFTYFYLIGSIFAFIIKLVFTFFYVLPVLVLLGLLVFVLITYNFIAYKYKHFFYYRIFYLNFNLLPLFIKINEFLLLRCKTLISYLSFKIRSLNYFLFSNIQSFISIGNLFKLPSETKFYLSSFLNSNLFYTNSLYYNSSFVFKRINQYYLRHGKFQFLHQFYYKRDHFRLTPDQFKAFKKIGLNSTYPVNYFERLFDIEYSRLELEYESPYYWSFMRQTYSINQGLLHPKFHVYGFFNFLKFYWNYFSFLTTHNIFNFESIYAQDFVQLLNSSVSQLFSHLIHDFFELLKLKKFLFYKSSTNSTEYFKFSIYSKFSGWYIFHVKYYDKVMHFFWDYFDNVFSKFLFYYYSVASKPKAILIYSFFNNYSEKARHNLGWLIFSFYERLMGKIFMNVNRFEDYYDVNFDKSIDKYDFYLAHLKRFFGASFLSTKKKRKFKYTSADTDEDEFSENLKNSVRFDDYLKRVAAQRKQDYMDTMSDFFSGSFSFFGHFYIFVRDNIFEFMAEWHTVWRDYSDNSVFRWAIFKKRVVFIFYFLKIFLMIWLFFFLIVVFSSLFLIKKIFTIIIIKIKNI